MNRLLLPQLQHLHAAVASAAEVRLPKHSNAEGIIKALHLLLNVMLHTTDVLAIIVEDQCLHAH
jgi:hypothetical protein